MNILLIDVDSKIPNLALMKISSYHKARGDKVGFNVADPDKIYISCIFKKNKPLVQSQTMMLKLQYPSATIEGGGDRIGFAQDTSARDRAMQTRL